MNERDMGLLPIMNPLFNLREICKQMALLEDHLNQPRKRCPDCIRKHFLTIEALFEEAVSLDDSRRYSQILDGQAEKIRVLQSAWVSGIPEEKISQALRAMRKSLTPVCFEVGITNLKEARVALRCTHRATLSDSEREDREAERLIAEEPKVKPSRKDRKRRRTFEKGQDKDLQGNGRGYDGDPDLAPKSRKLAMKYLGR